MHARLEQLLSLRDGEPVEAFTRDHVAKCASCAAQLTSLATTREQLRSLPMLDPPTELWTRISERLTDIDMRRSRMGPVLISVAAASVVAVAVGITYWYVPHESNATMQSDNKAQAELSVLVERSQRLEAALGALPQRPSVERVATAANIDGIEQRIQWLDFHLTAANDSLDQAQTQQLWQERVNLMDSLVKLRYAEARTAQL
jgi:hypothetical protein